MSLLAHASVGLTGAVSVEVRRVGDVVCDEHAAMVREDLGGEVSL